MLDSDASIKVKNLIPERDSIKRGIILTNFIKYRKRNDLNITETLILSIIIQKTIYKGLKPFLMPIYTLKSEIDRCYKTIALDLKKLVKKNYITRERRNIKNRKGCFYIYRITNKTLKIIYDENNISEFLLMEKAKQTEDDFILFEIEKDLNEELNKFIQNKENKLLETRLHANDTKVKIKKKLKLLNPKFKPTMLNSNWNTINTITITDAKELFNIWKNPKLVHKDQQLAIKECKILIVNCKRKNGNIKRIIEYRTSKNLKTIICYRD